MIKIESPFFFSGSVLNGRQDWASIFGNKGRLVLEIGCGIGDFVVEMAQCHPERNFIALDYYNKGCLKTCRRVERAGLSNVRVVRDEARSFVGRCISPESISALYINCPDPWPKRYQRKRRLVNSQFAIFMEPFLSKGADFYFATDFDDYGIDVANMLAEQPEYENMLAPDRWRHEIEGYPRTKYMRKFMAEGKSIFFVHYRRTFT